jgi:anaerobic selenocysteine-containing dehydrogenase
VRSPGTGTHMPRTAKSFCRNCGALCSMSLTVEGDKLISAVGDGTASPYGGYMCVKGLASIDFHNGAENRLLSSLRRDASDKLVETSASQAMDEIAHKLSALIAEHGPRSVAFFHGTGAYRSVLGGFLINTRLESRSYLLGDELTAADIQLGFVSEIVAARLGFAGYPNIDAWGKRFQARPAYKAAVARGGAYSSAS